MGFLYRGPGSCFGCARHVDGGWYGNLTDANAVWSAAVEAEELGGLSSSTVYIGEKCISLARRELQ